VDLDPGNVRRLASLNQIVAHEILDGLSTRLAGPGSKVAGARDGTLC